MNTFSTLQKGWQRAVYAAVAISVVLLSFVLLHSPKQSDTLMLGDIPIPFGMNNSSLKGSITLFGQRNGISVFEVEFNHGEASEHLTPNKIYLVRVPNATGVSDVPLDLALTLTGTGGHLVDYYGYRYTDAAATMERRDIQAFLFKDRFPGQFFASKTARDGDIAHGRSIAAFEAANRVTFLPTDGSTGSVRLDPAGALYVFIVNSPAGADLAIRNLVGCGNHILESAEQCDDGNSIDTDNCKNNCTIGFPIPFDGGPNGNGASLTLTQFSGSTGSALAGAVSIPLVRFTAIASDLTTIKHLAFAAEEGSFTTLERYRLWQDTNNDGVTDLPITLAAVPVGNNITFDSPSNWSGALALSHSGTIFELKADVPAGLQGVSSIRVGFAHTLQDFVGGQRVAGTFPLFGIKKNGVCTTEICQIFVTTAVSPLWNLSGATASSESSAASTTSAGSSTSSAASTTSGGSSASSTASTTSAGSSTSSTASATSSASSPTSLCGNSVINAGEECDDGNSVNTDDCDNSCQLSTPTPGFNGGAPSLCGNGVPNSGEECDDGNSVNTDDCDNTCHLTTPTPAL